jgi:hypothetical protein
MAIEKITGNETLEELQALMEAFQKRLAILDEKKSLTRPEIYAKVRSEYEDKIQEIQSLMLEKGANLEETLNQAVVDQDTLAIRKQELKDILDEMELRLAIGEIDEETKARQTQEHIEEMEEINGKLAALDQKIANFQKMMAAQPQKSTPAPAPVQMPEPPKPAQAFHQAAPTPQSRPAPRPQPEPVAPQAQMPQPRVEPRPVTAPKPIPAAAQEPPTTPRPAVKPPTLQPATASRPVPVQPTTPQTAAAVTATNEIDELEKQFASLLGESLAEATPKTTTKEESEPVEIVSKSAGAEEAAEENHEGELKCPKCGSFNRADNWYCEKCGNELISAQDLLGK